MKYAFDNDLHIHSGISNCSRDPEQTPERILQYAIDNGLKTVCITDHFWDSTVEGASEWYAPQNLEHISAALPLPQAEGVRFLFGCETELTRDLVAGVSKESFDAFDFVVLPTTHFHMGSYTLTDEQMASPEGKAKAWVDRFDAVLNMDLPFRKIGIPHLTSALIDRDKETFLKIIDLLPEDEMERLFTKAAALGVGIELNVSDMMFSDEEADIVLRPYRVAKRCGCKFYCSSDAHHPAIFEKVKGIMERAIDLIGLTENDKFII